MKKQSIPVEVKDLFEYNPVTGIIVWKKHPRLKGKIAGCLNTHGGIVLQFTLKGKRLRFQANRVIWYLHTNEDPGDLCVDHINRNRSDNRWENLRLVTHQQNSFNIKYIKDIIKTEMVGKFILEKKWATVNQLLCFTNILKQKKKQRMLIKNK